MTFTSARQNIGLSSGSLGREWNHRRCAPFRNRRCRMEGIRISKSGRATRNPRLLFVSSGLWHEAEAYPAEAPRGAFLLAIAISYIVVAPLNQRERGVERARVRAGHARNVHPAELNLGVLHGHAIAQRIQRDSNDIPRVQQGSLYRWADRRLTHL
jgi:hypothetical protein